MCSVTSVVSDSLQHHGPRPARLLCPWDSLGKKTGVGCHFLLRLIQIIHKNKHRNKETVFNLIARCLEKYISVGKQPASRGWP